MPNVLVTGASGSIGTAICCRLMESYSRVVAQGRKLPPKGIGHRQVATGPFHGALDWGEALEDVDYVVHGAALTWIDEGNQANALADFRRVNVEATAALMRDAAKAGVKRIVYLSSMTVHGGYAGKPFRYDDTIRPESPYAQSKAEAEEILREGAEKFGVEIVILRLPLVVGPEYSGNMAKLAALVRRGVPLPFGAIRTNRRCQLARENLLQAIELALKVHDAAGRIFLVSDGKPQSTREMVEGIGRRMRREPRFFPIPPWALRALVLLLPRAMLGKLSRQAMARELVGDYEIDICETRDVLGYRPQ